MNADDTMIGRRRVLGAAVAGFALSLPRLPAVAAEPAPFFKRHQLPLGLQLYTVGAAARKDLKGTLARVAAAGYQTVELAGLYGNSPQAMRQAADEAGLKYTSIHIQPQSTHGEPGFDQPPEVLAASMQVLGLQDVVLPMFLMPAHLPKPDARSGGYGGYLDQVGPLITVDDWKSTATFLNTKGAALQKVGLRLSYHNHNVEFRPIGDTCGLEILLDNTDPHIVHFEMDVGWVAAGGADPIKILEHRKGRFRMMHVKDLMATTKTNYAMRQDPAEVGSGMLPWRRILDVAYATGVRKFFVEQEPPFKGDPLDSIAISAKYLAAIA
ncbi:MAG TPA: sugar phosphate isomerase/epimerase [Steroidobacteraceae bacterium]|jgi:sugar phosphate isomerase/epimerase|nr:sugar phosphate isomerase/epimerase [Steroidobacteraceae bacterium]